ncbi:MAG TPA: lysophospholipid acyltransferase family protein [Bacteroidales bacterium]|nr:lysophospholipid acyltransferase family protein [Bacteroidales bacterium]HRW94392.1 lysophospholipid acyltransferase family protein [Bacteroidales bacterium]
MKAIFSRICFLVVYTTICLFSFLPLRLLYGLSFIFVVLPLRLGGYRKAVVTINMARSFPTKSYREIQRMVQDFYRYLGRLFAETIWLFTASGKSVMKRFSIEDCGVLESLREKGKSVVVMLPHMGNWEFLRACSCPGQTDICGYDVQQLHMVYQRLNSPLFDKLMITLRSRYKTGWKILESRRVARYMAQHRDEPGIYAMISDQCPGPVGKSVSGIFLNQPTLMIEGPEALARKYGFAVVYGVLHQSEKGRYALHISLITENAAETEEGAISRKFAALLEKDIERAPHLWLWSHKRWKRVPPSKA